MRCVAISEGSVAWAAIAASPRVKGGGRGPNGQDNRLDKKNSDDNRGDAPAGKYQYNERWAGKGSGRICPRIGRDSGCTRRAQGRRGRRRLAASDGSFPTAAPRSTGTTSALARAPFAARLPPRAEGRGRAGGRGGRRMGVRGQTTPGTPAPAAGATDTAAARAARGDLRPRSARGLACPASDELPRGAGPRARAIANSAVGARSAKQLLADIGPTREQRATPDLVSAQGAQVPRRVAKGNAGARPQRAIERAAVEDIQRSSPH